MNLLMQVVGNYTAADVLSFSKFLASVGAVLVIIGLMAMCKLATFNKQMIGCLVGGIGVILLAAALVMYFVQMDAPNGTFQNIQIERTQ